MPQASDAALGSSRLADLNQRFETSAPEEVLRWAVQEFPTDVILTCSFQHEGVVLAHMLRAIKPDVPVVFIDTGFHFKETLAYKDAIVKLLDLPLREVCRRMTFEEFKTRFGADLYDRDPDRCCRINKVEPLLEALDGVRCWINGRRRDQSHGRRALAPVEMQGPIVKVNPLANWTSKDTFVYMQAHAIPLHPLFERGYTSIGCEPCTALPLPDGDERSGRWAGKSKVECGIHTALDSPSTDDEKR
jgi:phosphoadenosine phosphosulfate reductase